MRMRLPTSSALKRASVTLAGALLSVLILAPAGEFVIKLLEEHGAYDHPSQKLRTLAAFLGSVANNSALHWSAGLTVAFALGAQAEGVLRRREAAARPAQNIPTERDRVEIERMREVWLGEPRNACLLLAGLVDSLGKFFYRQRGNPFAHLVMDKATNLRHSLEALDRVVAADSSATLDDVHAALADVVKNYRTCAAWVNRGLRADVTFLVSDEGHPERTLASWRADNIAFARNLEALMRRSAYESRTLGVEDDTTRILFDDDRWGGLALESRGEEPSNS
jgi:hypothetical protein